MSTVNYSDPAPEFVPPRPNDGCKWAIVGCGLFLLVGGIVLTVGMYFALKQGKKVAANISVAAAKDVLNNSELPEDQRQRLVEHIERLGAEFKKGELTFEELTQILTTAIHDKAFVTAVILYAVEHELLPGTELDETEQARAVRSIQRLARGIMEGKIELHVLEEVVEPIFEPADSNEGKRTVKENITPEDIEEMVVTATTLADEAEIPDEPFSVDVSVEFDRIVERVRRDR